MGEAQRFQSIAQVGQAFQPDIGDVSISGVSRDNASG
jgi:hypothetical protein